MRFNPETHYVVEGSVLNAVWEVALRLYSENRMNGDDMRNAAQRLDAQLNNAIEYSKKTEQ